MPQPARKPELQIVQTATPAHRLDHYINLFLQAKASKSQKTQNNYTNTLQQFRTYTGAVASWPVTPEHINGFMADCKLRELTDGTLYTYFGIIRSFCTWLHERGHLERNPINLAEKHTQPKPLPRAPAQSTLDVFFYKLRELAKRGHWLDVRALTLWSLALDTGLRVSELVSLSIYDVTNEKGRYSLFIAGRKTKRDRIVYFRKKTGKLLKLWREVRDALPLPPGLDALFVSYHDSEWGQLTDQGARQELVRRCKNFQIKPHLTPHQFRHAHGVYWMQEAGSLKDLQFQLGHTNLTTTQRYAVVEDVERAKRYRKHFKKKK